MAHSLRSACCVAALGVALWARRRGSPTSPPPSPSPRRGVLIRFEGFIGPGNEQYLRRKLENAKAYLEKAKARDAGLVIIEIESPGGRVDSSEAIGEMLRDVYWAHTVAYIPHNAYSGAAMAALGCDEIVMAPDAILGDVGEIYLEHSEFKYIPEKVLSQLVQWMHEIAIAKNRPPALAEAMVDKKLTVYRSQNLKTGETTYLSQRDLDADPGQWRKLSTLPETGDRFFTVTGRNALKLGLAQGLAADRDELLARYPLEGDLLVLEPGAVDTLVQIINSPWITGLLLVVGLIGLYLEFSTPGIGVGGLLAAICFVTFFWSHFLGNPVAWLSIVLFLLGVACLGVELFVLPGLAVAGLVGAILMIGGVVLAIQGFFIPKTPRDLATLMQTVLVIFFSGLSFVVAAVFISKRFGSLPIFNRLMLPPPEPVPAGGGLPDGQDTAAGGGPPGPPSGPPIAVGRIGIAQSTLRPGGKARFGNHYADVVTDGTFITKGSRVKIIEIVGNRVVVGEADEEPA